MRKARPRLEVDIGDPVVKVEEMLGAGFAANERQRDRQAAKWQLARVQSLIGGFPLLVVASEVRVDSSPTGTGWILVSNRADCAPASVRIYTVAV